jgi:hypothetical protein
VGDKLEVCGIPFSGGIHWVHNNCGDTPTNSDPDGWIKKVSADGSVEQNLEARRISTSGRITEMRIHVASALAALGSPRAIARPRIMSAAFSPIMIAGAFVLPATIVGMRDASTTRKPSRRSRATGGPLRTTHRCPCGTCRPDETGFPRDDESGRE